MNIGPKSEAQLALEMTPEDFGRWKHHPVSQVFLAFMRAQAQNWRDAAMDLWMEGGFSRPGESPNLDQNFLRGQVMALSSTANVHLTDIQDFFREQLAEHESASE